MQATATSPLPTSCWKSRQGVMWRIVSILQPPAPTRLVPIGLVGSLAVKLVGSSMLVGRLPCCRVEIPLPTVSSHHCRLSRVGPRWYIEDLDSRNGTFVNGRPIRRRRLRIGDKVSIGEFAFRVE